MKNNQLIDNRRAWSHQAAWWELGRRGRLQPLNEGFLYGSPEQLADDCWCCQSGVSSAQGERHG